MNRRLVSALAAGVLALLGAVLLISYVNGAENRAMAEMDPVDVLVVTAPIVQGTPAEVIASSVTTEQLPAAAVGPGAVKSLSELNGRVAVTDLQLGEQLLAGRFADPISLEKFGGIPVPEGLHQVTVPLESSRVVGGTVTPGSQVGVFATFEIDGVAKTHLIFHKILATRVQGGLSPSAPAPEGSEDAAAADPAAAPMHEGATMVTLAVNARDAEKIVFAAENGSIWLSLVDPATPEDGTRIVEPGNVYE